MVEGTRRKMLFLNMELRNLILLLLFVSMGGWSCQSPPSELPSPELGVSRSLADQRKALISDLHYRLFFSIPSDREEEIPARVTVGFRYQGGVEPLVLDFREQPSRVKSVTSGEKALPYRMESGHVILPPGAVQDGYNEVEIEFTAGELSLNRSEEYLYTLLVPDRASTVFPCFDQPNLKARFELTLQVPAEWRAMSNGKITDHFTEEGRQTFHFAPTQPISTYLFAFTAGKFQTATHEAGARPMTLYYRETDTVKVNRNLPEIFRLHAASLEWLENYTGIPYPFDKFDFTTIPTFQYGGMEHVGAIFYRESSLFLDENATDNQLLGRASLIAHETAHMWFGDLVTMEWFDDVWLKEVFANFMAAKIVNPSFPQIDHELRFLMNHQPTAYSEDRSPGTHPIQQPLENLRDAGTLYGRIIYQKAPVVMHQLEETLGSDQMREGLREYLQTYSLGNATWDDLIRILDSRSKDDLNNWSEVWVKEGGMPEYLVSRLPGEGGTEVALTSGSSSPRGNNWKQKTKVVAVKDGSEWNAPLEVGGEEVRVSIPSSFGTPDFVLAAGSSGSYGYFALDNPSRDFLLREGVKNVKTPLTRGALWISLYEEMLRERIPARKFLAMIMDALPGEKEPLTFQYLLGRLTQTYWQFLNQKDREALAPALEELLWTDLQTARSTKRKAALWRAYQNTALSPAAVARLRRAWAGELQIAGLPFSERDLTDLAGALAVREVTGAEEILNQQQERIKNPDRRRRFQFIRPALSSDPTVRDSFFESLRQAENRHYEPWVGSALAYLHHPLRASHSLRYIQPSLELMEEIQQTGDIFFPKRWISATLSGHQSPEAARIVKGFLAERPEYPYRLKNKILQAADLLFRSEVLVAQDLAK